MKPLPLRLLAIGLGLGCLLSAGVCLQASTVIVTSLNDSGTGSLRDAVNTADTVTFNPGLTGVIALTGGSLHIQHNITILGPGAASLTVSNTSGFNSDGRVFFCQSGTTNWISGLTIAGGKNLGDNGQNVHKNCDNPLYPTVAPDLGALGAGGAIYSDGRLTLQDCVLAGNSAVGGSGGSGNPSAGSGCGPFDGDADPKDGAQGGDAYGGAIYANGLLLATRCTFAFNSATGGTGGAGGPPDSPSNFHHTGGWGGNARGGVVYVQGGHASFVNCTFYGNTAQGGSGGIGSPGANGGNGSDGAGGAIYLNSGAISAFNNTISGNASIAGPGGIAANSGQSDGASGNTYGGGIHVNSGSTFSISSTLVALNSSSMPDVGGTVNSQGHNLIGKTDGSSGWIGSDKTGTVANPLNPLLGPLQNNGGSTPTLELFTGSPAIDAGATTITTDQRGLPRIDFAVVPNNSGGDGSDIGAFEIQRLVMDIGLRAFDGLATNKIAGEYPTVSPMQIRKNGTNYGVLLVPTNSPYASKFRIQTTSGTMAMQKLP